MGPGRRAAPAPQSRADVAQFPAYAPLRQPGAALSLRTAPPYRGRGPRRYWGWKFSGGEPSSNGISSSIYANSKLTK